MGFSMKQKSLRRRKIERYLRKIKCFFKRLCWMKLSKPVRETFHYLEFHPSPDISAYDLYLAEEHRRKFLMVSCHVNWNDIEGNRNAVLRHLEKREESIPPNIRKHFKTGEIELTIGWKDYYEGYEN